MSHPTLIQMAWRAQQGDEAAMEALLTKLWPRIRGFFYKRISSAPDAADLADDLTQETLIRVASRLGEAVFTDEYGLLGWCFEVGRNIVADHFRSPRNRTIHITSEEEAWRRPDAEDRVFGGGDENGVPLPDQRVSGILKGVHDNVRDDTARLLCAYLVERSTWPEVAAELGTTAAGAKRRWQRAQVSMRKAVLRGINELPAVERKEVLRRYNWLDEGPYDP
jgi:RNA polymerase sigma factor (sigma-70 family)